MASSSSCASLLKSVEKRRFCLSFTNRSPNRVLVGSSDYGDARTRDWPAAPERLGRDQEPNLADHLRGCYASPMRTVLSMLLVLLLTVHGPLAGAVPHDHETGHHGLEVSGEPDHHGNHESAEPQHMSGVEAHSANAVAASHHHMVGDTVNATAAVMSQSRQKGPKRARFNDAKLSSAVLSPIPEPPIA
jgi:hypothetical protein